MDDPTIAARPSDAGLRASVSLLRRNRDFRALFFASVISLGGDWFLWVAINGLVYEATGKALYVGLAILAQESAFFLASPIGGALADRIDRRKLMIACDLVRAVVCVSFLLVGPETIWLAYVLLPVLATFAAPFDPAFSAATPNVVDPDDLPAANALNGSLWGTMLAVGAGLGGLVSAAFGDDTAFIVDAVSFLVSAALLSSIRRGFSESRTETTEHPSIVDATRETWRFARRDHRVLSLLAVKFGFGAAAGLLALIPVMALDADVFDSGNVGFGILMAARGVGALIGPFLGHRIAGPGHRRLFPAIGLSLAVFGLGYVAMGQAPSLTIAAVMICVAHLGGGSQWMLSTYGLQVLVPDHIRGRIFGFDYMLITLSLSLSALVASAVADQIGAPNTVTILGGVALVWALVWFVLSRGVRRTGLNGSTSPEPDAGSEPIPSIS
ncbi:MAG: major facilitator superfamily 1 [Actinomycetia bacterium]|nr:major facilitator superfamily 1 [Actinomycetes bacterium]